MNNPLPKLAISLESSPSENGSVIFLHGSGANSQMWSKHFESIGGNWHCIAPDFPGHGKSRDIEWTTLEDVADSVALVILEKCGGKASLVGLSLGGSVIFKILQKYPQLICSAIIDGASAKPIAGARMICFGVKLIAPFIKYNPVIKIMAGALGVDSRGFQSFSDSMKSVTPRAFGRAMTQANMADMDINSFNINIPILFMSGESEASIMHSTHIELASKIPGSKFYIHPDAGHAWMIKDTRTHINLVQSWLTENHKSQQS